VNWMIDIQLARRNLTPEQKSYLRGQRYQREKTAGHGDQSALNNYGQTTADRLATEYKVSPGQIKKDAQFAAAGETLEEIRPDLPQAILTRKDRGKAKGKR
jgi:hypothetical protein